MDGWIKLHRKSMHSAVFKNPIIWMVWCWCLMEASHDTHTFPFNGVDLEIKGGQFITGRNKAVQSLPITVQQYRTAMGYLKSTSRITIKTTNKFSMITVLKWKEYQTTNQLSNQQLTSQQPTTNQQLTTYKNDNNSKNVKKLAEAEAVGVVEVLEIFRSSINPTIKVQNKTYRDDAKFMIDTYGLDLTLDAARFAIEHYTEDFFPKISNPSELRNKYTALLDKRKNYGY